MGKTPLQSQDKYVLRLPDGMRDRIKEAAEKNNRSMNAEMVARLEDSFRFGQDGFFGISPEEAQLAQEIRNLRQDIFDIKNGFLRHPDLDKK